MGSRGYFVGDDLGRERKLGGMCHRFSPFGGRQDCYAMGPGKDVSGIKSGNRVEGVVILRINSVHPEAQARAFWQALERECRRAVI